MADVEFIGAHLVATPDIFCRMFASYGLLCCYGGCVCGNRMGAVPSWRRREIRAVVAGAACRLGGSRAGTGYSSRPTVPATAWPSPDLDVLRYFNSASFRRLSLNSQISYAYDLRLHFSFLSSQGINWRDATEEHLVDFEYWRRRDEHNPRRVGGAKFARELTACRRFYEWQEKRGVISRSPVEVRAVPQRDGSFVEVARLQPSNRRSVQMKWLTPAAYRQWCNVGLAGYCSDDSYDGSWRGRNASRNMAFAETMWSSGLRLREGATLLFAELPSTESSAYPSARLGEAVAKGRGRDYWISRQALAAIRTYRNWSRAEAVRRAQDQGRYDDVAGIMIQVSVTSHRQLIYKDLHGNEGMVSLDSLHADERHKVFVEGEHGLEPAMVWLSEAGLPMPHTTWQKVFQVANARCEAQGLKDRSCHPHALRHSFALRWLCVFLHAHDRRFGLTPQERDEFRRTFGDAYTMVSQLLGHSSKEVTEQIYLEPARDLPLELFLSEADGEIESAQYLLSLIAASDSRIQDVAR